MGKVLPQLQGKLTGNAIRVPTPNVSIAILNLTLKRETTVEEINEYMRRIAMHSELRKQIDYSNSPEVVSTDFVGSRHACIFDSEGTIVNGAHATQHVVLEQMAGVHYSIYPTFD